MGAMLSSGFEIDGGLALVLARALSVGSLLSLFGALAFRVMVAPPVLAGMGGYGAAIFHRQWRTLARGSVSAAAASMLAWLVLQAASMADAKGPAAAVAAVPAVLASTRFGHLLLLQLGALALAALFLRGGERHPWPATTMAALAVALQAGHSHAASMEGGLSLLLLASLVHIMAAGVWLGGLAPLSLLLGVSPRTQAAEAARRFSVIGIVCVLLMAATATFQASVLIGSWPGFVGTGYGLAALLKLALFAVLLGFAAHHRFHLTPGVADGPGGTLRRLRRSIAMETGVGVGVILAAGLLTSLPPAMHVQPVWPFPAQISLEAVQEDDDFRREVIEAAIALAGAAVLLAAGVSIRRIRWPALAVSAAVGWLAAPHLGVLLAEAHPTSFYHSPTDFAAGSIAEGAALFAGHCAACHGVEGRGDGPAAASLPIPPADLTASHLRMHSDGELFWWLLHGIDAPEGGLAMPGFASVLSDDARWALIDYIRANNAGWEVIRNGFWVQPIQAPQFQADCAGNIRTLHDFQGRFVRVVIGGVAPADSNPALVNVFTAPSPQPGACVVADAAIPAALAIVSGLQGADLTGDQFLIDENGWLREVQKSPPGSAWTGSGGLDAALRRARDRPIKAAASVMHMPM